ncbi:F-box protein CPR30 [Striga hermonthica]|uniref:F-box protein CPR30 n=1 Tax=Striga hermonthica TaxID=68872 RepID=A0A9N7NF28_STRHE|nr:F-box protein CPR30 [Striga hermonthica]
MEAQKIPPNPQTLIHPKKPRSTHRIKALDLPPEITMEILLRLPVKSLLRFRSVSKSWLALISSSQFIKAHLGISASSPTMANHRLMLTICNPNFDLKQCSIKSVFFDPLTAASNIEYPKEDPYSAVWVVGSVNGLVCLAMDEKDMFLWNPATGEHRKLPPVAIKLRQGFYYIWGFGHDEVDDDYKVVGIFCEFGNGGLHKSTVMIYSLKANSWKMIEDFKGGIPLDDTGKFASGRLHFPATPGLGERRWDIVSLDLRNEAYGTVGQPEYRDGGMGSSLGVLGDCLCVVCDFEKVRTDVWVLREYGNEDSWYKVVTIPYVEDPRNFLHTKPLTVLPSGEVLLAVGLNLVVYDPRANCFRRPGMSNVGLFLEVDVYVESLVPV